MKKKRLMKMLARHLDQIERVHADVAGIRNDVYRLRDDCEQASDRAAKHSKKAEEAAIGSANHAKTSIRNANRYGMRMPNRDARGRFLADTPTSRAYRHVKGEMARGEDVT